MVGVGWRIGTPAPYSWHIAMRALESNRRPWLTVDCYECAPRMCDALLISCWRRVLATRLGLRATSGQMRPKFGDEHRATFPT